MLFDTQDIAISRGRVYELNAEDFFEIGKTFVKTVTQSPALHLGTASDYDPTWTSHVYKAYGPRGLIATAFFMGPDRKRRISESALLKAIKEMQNNIMKPRNRPRRRYPDL